MPFDKNDLLDDDETSSLTIRDIFSAEVLAVEVATKKIVDALMENKNDSDEPHDQQEEADNPESFNQKIEHASSLYSPEFDFDDTTKTILAKNAWHHQEAKIASGGYHSADQYRSKESIMEEAILMLKSNLKTYDLLPHKNFINVQPMEHPNQIVHTFNGLVLAGIERGDAPYEQLTQVTSAVVSAEQRKVGSCSITIEAMQYCRYMPGNQMADELAEAVAENVAYELSQEMMAKFKETAATCTMATNIDETPSSKDILRAIYEAAEEIAQASECNRGSANWVIVGKEAAAILLKDKKIDTTDKEKGLTHSLLGTLHGFNIFMDNYNDLDSNELYVGRKSDKTLGAGLTYFPHTLIADSSMIVDPSTFCSAKALYTRDAWHIAKEIGNDIIRIKFKKALVDYKAAKAEMDAGFFYAPYIPIFKTSSIEGADEHSEELEDIILPFGPEEQITIASLFGKEKENE